MVEALAALKAIKLAPFLGLQRVIIKDDSLSIMKKYSSNQQDLSELCAYIGDIKNHECLF